MLIKLWLEAMEQNLFACSLYRTETAAKFQQEWHCDGEFIEGSWKCQLVFHFLKNIERGGKHAQKPSIVIVLLALILQYFFFFVTSCHFTLLLVIVSDLKLHSLISKHAEQKKKP